MPIYDYRCLKCGEISEILVRTSHKGEIKCPLCGSQNLEKMVSASYVVRPEGRAPGTTCCGQSERCEQPPCSTGDTCRRR
jgi:putative FmdB family regulatory protein